MEQIDNVNVTRIRDLAEFLDTIPAQNFTIHRWVDQLPVGRQTKWFGLVETKPACGFAGCAMGWAAYSHLFSGLSLYVGDSESIISEAIISYRHPDTGYNIHGGFSVAEELFGISRSVAEFFFHQCKYKFHEDTLPGEVASRLRRFADKIEAIRARRPKVKTDISVLVKLTNIKTKEVLHG